MDSGKLYQKISSDYDAISRDWSNKKSRPGEKMRLALPYLKKGMRILDLGCGSGRFYSVIPEGIDYTGVDFSAELLSIASKTYPRAKFILGNMADDNIWIKLSKFDAVFVLASFHHLPDIKEQEKVLKLIRQSLNLNGILMITVFNLWSLKNWHYHFEQRNFKSLLVPWKLSDGKKVTKVIQRFYYGFTPYSLKNLITKNGFKVNRQFYTHGKTIFTANEFGLIAVKC